MILSSPSTLILDHWGIVKANIGIKHGQSATIGKAGNPDVQPNITMIIGPSTEVIAGEGSIITAGGIDRLLTCEPARVLPLAQLYFMH